jgi:membrane protein
MKPKKPSLWKFGGLTPLDMVRSLWKELSEDEVGVRSASLSYYFILALFPAMFFILSLLGLLAGPGSQLRDSLFSNLPRLLPGSASDLMRKTLMEIIGSAGAGKAAFGILGALWSAAGGILALMQSLNVAYELKEDRPTWKQYAVAIGLTTALAVLVLTALGLTVYGGKAADILGNHGLGHTTVLAWKIVQWPVVLALMFLAFSVTYYFGPNLEKPEWHWITPGSAVGLFGWLIASFGFKIYLHFFNSYSKTYGSLGAAIILLLWLYISGYSILLGGEVNSIIGRAADAQIERSCWEEKIEREIKAA